MASLPLLLDKKKIQDLLQDPRITLEIFDTLPSTQEYLHEKQNLHHLDCCLTEDQPQGKGRLKRAWVGPKNRNVYLSFCFIFHRKSNELAGLSLAIGIIVTDVLRHLFPTLLPQLKWPNDIYLDSKKLGGILVEIKEETSDHCKTIVGIGLNVNMKDIPTLETNQPWISLEHGLEAPVDRNLLVGHLLPALTAGLELFEKKGLTPFLEQWKAYDFLEGKMISVQRGEEISTGLACGITPEGHLHMSLPSGKLQAFSSGNAQILKD